MAQTNNAAYTAISRSHDMATESIVSTETMEEIYRELLNIQALAQVLQKATVSLNDATAGIYGTVSIIESCADRAIELTGV